MSRRKLHQIVPAILMAATAAVPLVTTAEILTHASATGSSIGAQLAAPVALAPQRNGSGGGSVSVTSSGGTRTYSGPVITQPYGGVQAVVTMNGTRITGIAISAPQNNSRSASINQQAVPYLRTETLQAQSAQINGVSGATYTSRAYQRSLQAALNTARAHGNAPAGSQTPGQGTVAVGHKPAVKGGGDD